MKCVVLIKKDIVLFKKEAARANPLWMSSGKFCERNCFQRQTLGH